MIISVTDKAVQEIKRLQSSDPSNAQASLRVQIVGGGCSGMSYKLSFEAAEPTEHDTVTEKDGVKVLIDKKSSLYLKGTELDFSDGLNGTGFTFNNPNAKRSCGCGSSFST